MALSRNDDKPFELPALAVAVVGAPAIGAMDEIVGMVKDMAISATDYLVQ